MSTLIGICGGSGSGKTTLATSLQRWFGPDRAAVISLDSYYRDLSNLSLEERALVNFDHPDSLDEQLLVEQLDAIGNGGEIAVPVYDFTTHTRSADIAIVEPLEVVIVEGILLFAFEEVRSKLDLLVFRQCPEPIRADRREARDVNQRGRTPESVRSQWAATVLPMHTEYVEPHQSHADVIVGHERSLADAVEMVATRISTLAGIGKTDS